jgi:hypothetical protein
MYIHSIHSQHIQRNVRIEVVYEDNPVFADEEVSAIIRFRHLGEAVVKTQEEAPAEDRKPAEEGSSGWFGKRLSLQLSNATRSLFLEESDKEESGSTQNKPIDLTTGFVQLSGYITYDPHVINHEKIEEFRKKSAISGKIGGLDGLELTKSHGNGIFDKISGYFNQELDTMADEQDEKNKNLETMVPFFSTPKSLLFSEVNLQPGETQIFYFKCRLPRALPPTYDGRGIKIHYRLIAGASLDQKLPTPVNVHFPLRISQNFDENGYQPVASLDKFILLSSDKLFNELFQSKTGRRSSFKTIKNMILTQPKLSQTNKKELFLKQLDQLIQHPDEQPQFKIDDFKTSSVMENISLYTEALITKGEVDQDDETVKRDGYVFQKQVTKLQTQYIINYNSQHISTLTFSKPIYKIGEAVKISLDLSSNDVSTTGILVSLETIEMIRESYGADQEETSSSITHFKESYTTMQMESIQLSIPIPLSSTAQFKTNIFESKWCLVIKFILTKDELQRKVHEDSTGELTFAKEQMGGFEFNCRLPLTVLPSDQDFGGIIV